MAGLFYFVGHKRLHSLAFPGRDISPLPAPAFRTASGHGNADADADEFDYFNNDGEDEAPDPEDEEDEGGTMGYLGHGMELRPRDNRSGIVGVIVGTGTEPDCERKRNSGRKRVREAQRLRGGEKSLSPAADVSWEITQQPPPPCQLSQQFIVKLSALDTGPKAASIANLLNTLSRGGMNSTIPLPASSEDPSSLQFWIYRCHLDDINAQHQSFNCMLNLLFLTIHLNM